MPWCTALALNSGADETEEVSATSKNGKPEISCPACYWGLTLPGEKIADCNFLMRARAVSGLCAGVIIGAATLAPADFPS